MSAWHKKDHKCVRNFFFYITLIAQFLGMLPITDAIKNPRFKWNSLKVLYTVLLIVGNATILFFGLTDWFYYSRSFASIDMLIYKSGICFVLSYYLKFAKKWPKLIKQWCYIDEIFNRHYGTLKYLKLRINVILIIFLTVTVGMVMLPICQLTGIYSHRRGRSSSSSTPVSLSNNTAVIVFFFYLRTEAILLQLFSDFFIILLCTVIALRFQQLSTHLESTENLKKPPNFWLIIRQDYNLLADLTQKINNGLGGVLLATFTIHTYRLLCFLYTSLVVDLFSLSNFQPWFIGEFLCMCWYIAWVNVESLKPVKVLNSVPSSEFDLEIMRLLSKISYDEVALTPCKIFKVTQLFLLSMVNTIVTYELVLIQFSSFSSIQQASSG